MRTSAISVVGVLLCTGLTTGYAAGTAGNIGYYQGPPGGPSIHTNSNRPMGIATGLAGDSQSMIGPSGGSDTTPAGISRINAWDGAGDDSFNNRAGGGGVVSFGGSGSDNGDNGNSGGDNSGNDNSGGDNSGGGSSGGDNSGSGNSGGDNSGGSSGGDNGGGGSGENIRAYQPARVTLTQRLYNSPKAPGSLSKPAQLAVAGAAGALNALPPTARNYSLSMLYTPSTPSEGTEAQKALSVLRAVPATDLRRMFSTPSQVSDAQLAKLYKERIQQLASPAPLSFSGEKMVVLVASGQGAHVDSELQRTAHLSTSFAGMKADAVLAGVLDGVLEKSNAQSLYDSLAAATAVQQAEWWFVGNAAASLPQTRQALGIGGQPATAATEATPRVTLENARALSDQVAKLGVVAATPANLQLLKGSGAMLQQLRERKEDLSAAKAAGTLFEQVLGAAHPNVIVAQVQGADQTRQVLKSVASNPWYGNQARTVLLVEDSRGTQLLQF